MTDKNLAHMLEHTILADNITEDILVAHINEAKQLGVFGVCIPLAWVPLAKKLLIGTPIKVVTVIDFPLGKNTPEEKAKEARSAVALGADEIDMVLDYQALIRKDYQKVLDGIIAVVEAAHPIPIKVIIETSALDEGQKAAAITLVALSKAQFIKTSTGFHHHGAQIEDIALMRHLLPDGVFIKASGGIRDHKSAEAMIKAGAVRIGASKSREILYNL